MGWVARLPARVQTKLLVAFLSIVGLLIVLGAVGLQVLSGVNDQTNELIKLQRRIAAYRQVQHDTTNQLYSISTALLLQDDRMLDAALRQLNQFGYDLDRMEFVAEVEAEVLGQVRQEYDRFTAGVTHVVELVRAGRTEEARKVQQAEIMPSADRLERLTNQLVNIAEADMVAAIETTEGAYGTSRLIVVSFAVGSILLALGLGYIISWSLIEPVKKIETRLRQIAAGDFAQQVAVANRDELGVLAGNVNQTSEQLGRLYQEVQARTAELARSVAELEALGEVSKAVNSTLDLDTVLQTIVAKAVQLSDTDAGTIYVFSSTRQQFRPRATYGMSDELIAAISDQAIGLNDPGIGDAARRRAPVQVPDLSEGTPSPAQKI
ncbi:MAG: HAMP domain-containing protein, partial [Mesorhizobium sp.]